MTPSRCARLLLLGVFVLLVAVGDSASDRLRSAFRFGAFAKGAEARIDAWVTPPAYTGRPPVMLADGAHGLAGRRRRWPRPTRSRTAASWSFAAPARHRRADAGVSGQQRRDRADRGAGAGQRHRRVRAQARGAQVGHRDGVRSAASAAAAGRSRSSPIIRPRLPSPRTPEKSPRGALKLFFKVEDDYGVVSAETRIRRVRPKEDKTSTAWARAGAKKGARPPHERPPALALRLPRAYPKQAEGQSFHEIGDHPWAGMTVELSLVAKDLAGQTGRSAPIEMVLPERRFTKPLARAVVEQRRRLAEDPRDRPQVARAIDAITLEPEEFIEDLQVFLGLRSAYWRLQQRRHARGAQQHRRPALEHCAAHRGRQPDGRRARPARRPGALAEGARARRLRRGDPEADAGAAAGAGAVPRAALQAGAERSRPCRGWTATTSS